MTERLYYTDAYLRTFEAHVVERREGGRVVYLDRSAFYPTSGGQPHDTGTLAGVPVEDVVDEGERVAHHLSGPVDATTVRGEIDWPRRFDHMQQHTGQHLLSALFADAYARPTVSVHFGPALSTLELERGEVGDDVVREVEARANALVMADLPVTVAFEEAAEASGLRKPPDRGGTLRIVSIAGLDRSACGGTHVRRTGEIGPVLLRRRERVRQHTRLEFVCGQRAVERAHRDFETLQAIATGLSAAPDDAAALVEAQAAQVREWQSTARRLQEELDGHRARARYAASTPGENGLRCAVERRATGAVDDLRGEALAFAALSRTLFIGATATPPAILVAASEDSGVAAGTTLRGVLAQVGGRGGGSPRLAQGSVPSVEALDAALRLLTVPAGE